MAKTLMINGKDYTSFFTSRGYSVQYTVVSGNQGGVMLDGTYTEDELAVKAVIILTCMPLNEAQLSEILIEVSGYPYHTVTYFDPKIKAARTILARRSVSQQKYRGFGTDQNAYWTGTVITFTER